MENDWDVDMKDGKGVDTSESKPLLSSATPKTHHLAPQRPLKTFDSLLEKTRVGVFHVVLIFVAGWTLASDSVEVQCISFVTPKLDEYNATSPLKPSKVEEGALDAVIFLGMMVGGYVWGSLSDVVGRRSCLITSLTFNGVFGVASGLSPDYSSFLVLRFFSGIGVGGSLPVVFSYFCEFFSRKTRGPFVIILAGFWTVGQIFAALMAWIVIGNESVYDSIHGHVGSVEMVGWRAYVMLCSFPCLSAAVLLVFMPESPSFLYAKGKLTKAMKVLERIEKFNGYCQIFNCCCCNHKFISCYRFPRSHTSFEDDINTLEPPPPQPRTSMLEKVFIIFRSTQELFGLKYLRQMVILMVVWFTLSFGYYGLLLWFPEYFKCIQEKQNQCYFEKDDVCVSSNFTTKCNSTSNIYLDSLYASLATIPGTVLGVLTVNIIGAKIMLGSAVTVSGLSTLLIKVVPKKEGVLVILSCVFSGVSVIAWNAIDVISTSELFPVQSRSTAIAIQTVLGRIGAILGNLTFGELITLDPFIPIMIVAVILIAGGLVGFFLPSLPNEKKSKRKICHWSRWCRSCYRHLPWKLGSSVDIDTYYGPVQ